MTCSLRVGGQGLKNERKHLKDDLLRVLGALRLLQRGSAQRRQLRPSLRGHLEGILHRMNVTFLKRRTL